MTCSQEIILYFIIIPLASLIVYSYIEQIRMDKLKRKAKLKAMRKAKYDYLRGIEKVNEPIKTHSQL